MVTASPEDTQEKDADTEGLIVFPDGVDPVAVITAAVRDVAIAEINRLTGRVD
jgi:hypothetical protein